VTAPRPCWLRSACFSIGMILATVVWAPLSVLTLPLPYRTRYELITAWAAFVLWWLRLTCKIETEVQGRENLPDQPAVVLCQHQSTWETLFLTQVFRPQVWVLKRELLWVPFFGWAIALLRPIAINRLAGRSAMRQVLAQGTERLRDGCYVVVFPEGTRVAPGERRRHAVGGALLATHSGAPVVPIAHNAGRCWPRRRFLKHPGKIRVVIGELIPTTELKSEELRAQVQAWMEETSRAIDSADQWSERAAGIPRSGAGDEPRV